ncbi:hypothetical protein RRG08_022658 [Elysia crispata]|uniref:Phorbol-ester/DAG-type domain-containing protein n=1 Tax=Elysia crispata TaxID=231223 RepID=A0AAE0Z1S8_9GAST|nr:hypothetical protein RRG08_022658 [Elysia crispata]
MLKASPRVMSASKVSIINKEKESKSKHRFVAISFSNATACDVCNKPMANKSALRCENCLVNVHEHNCKDQYTQCDKNRSKVSGCLVFSFACIWARCRPRCPSASGLDSFIVYETPAMTIQAPKPTAKLFALYKTILDSFTIGSWADNRILELIIHPACVPHTVSRKIQSDSDRPMYIFGSGYWGHVAPMTFKINEAV